MKYHAVIVENEKKIFIGVFETKCFYRIGSGLPKEHFTQSLMFRKREVLNGWDTRKTKKRRERRLLGG